MGKAAQEGSLARTHEGKPGLPRGRNRLPALTVRASQRQRLLRAVIAAVAESGYAPITVADIVRRAKVSRAAFYAHFSSKDDCLLTATGEGGQILVGQVLTAARRAGEEPEDALRAGCRAFLAFLSAEPAFAQVIYVYMPVVGPTAIQRVQAVSDHFAAINRKWHQQARERHPEWPTVPGEAYLALAGATAEIVRAWVRADRTKELPDLEDTLVSLHLAVLAGRPWGLARRVPSARTHEPGSGRGRSRSPGARRARWR
ncbi:MAG TPA: TetR/AcrR family transcriptional regulator [Trebonia sp.]|nr:TetR/AcrR family transcriptional regulator [Trebonia sp.]